MNVTEVTEGNDIYLTARVRLADSTLVDSADFASAAGGDTVIEVRVFDMTKESLGTGSNGRQVLSDDITKTDIGTYLFDTLQTDGYWNGVDDTGYNFRYRAKASGSAPVFAYEAGHRYQIEFALLTDSQGKIRWAQQFYVRSLLAL